MFKKFINSFKRTEEDKKRSRCRSSFHVKSAEGHSFTTRGERENAKDISNRTLERIGLKRKS